MKLYSLIKGWPDADDLFTLAAVLPLALFAGTIGGTVGFGSAVILIAAECNRRPVPSFKGA